MQPTGVTSVVWLLATPVNYINMNNLLLNFPAYICAIVEIKGVKHNENSLLIHYNNYPFQNSKLSVQYGNYKLSLNYTYL